MNTPPIVSSAEWEAAREQLLVKEKELTRARDAMAAARRRMPWLAVEEDYEFDGPKGKASLLDLFDGRRPGRSRRPPQRAQHDARVRLAGAAAGHRAREGADGLGDALVHDHRQLRSRFRRRRVARHQRVHPRC